MEDGLKEVKVFEIPSDLLEKMDQARGYSATIDDIASWDQVLITEQRIQPKMSSSTFSTALYFYE